MSQPKTVRELMALLEHMDPDAYVLVNSDGSGAPPLPWAGSVEARELGASRYEVPTVVLAGDMWRDDYPERVRDPMEGAFTYTVTDVRNGAADIAGQVFAEEMMTLATAWSRDATRWMVREIQSRDDLVQEIRQAEPKVTGVHTANGVVAVDDFLADATTEQLRGLLDDIRMVAAVRARSERL